MFAPGREPHSRVLAAHGLFDAIQQRDLAQHLFGDGRAFVLEALHEAAADMRPAVNQLPRTIFARDLGQRVVGLVGITLQEATMIPGEDLRRMLLAAAGGVVDSTMGGLTPP